MMLAGHSETRTVCLSSLIVLVCVCVCDLLMPLVPKACVSEVMDELLCASLFPIIGFSSVCARVCVNCLPYRSCFHWNDDLIVESGAVQWFESHLYMQLCLYKSLWLISYQTENQSVASSEQLTGLGLLTCGRELCFLSSWQLVCPLYRRCKGVIDSRGQRISCSHFVVEEGYVGSDRKRAATPTRSESGSYTSFTHNVGHFPSRETSL